MNHHTIESSKLRQDYLPFHRPAIGPEEIAAVVRAMQSGWLTTGPVVREFEAAFAAYIGCKHAIAVNSCTAALHLALEAIGLGPGDEVIIPTMTFAATAEVVIYFGATPVLVDCHADSLNIDARLIERRITPRTKAIIPVHFAGQPCEMEQILDIARRHNLVVIDDAAHALPAADAGRRVGTIADISCFSFYATKTITTGEGGMITTDNDAWAERMRMMSLHGISKDAWKRYTAAGSWYYEILYPGYKYNLTDIAAAMGTEQLKKADAFWQERVALMEAYQRELAGCDVLELPSARPDVQHAWHLYVVRLDLARLMIDRAEFIEQMKARNIGTSVHFIPLHLHPYYRDTFGLEPDDYPVATEISRRTISLPLFPGMSDADVNDVVAAVKDVVAGARAV